LIHFYKRASAEKIENIFEIKVNPLNNFVM